MFVHGNVPFDDKRNARIIRAYGSATDRHRRPITLSIVLFISIVFTLLIMQFSTVADVLSTMREPLVEVAAPQRVHKKLGDDTPNAGDDRRSTLAEIPRSQAIVNEITSGKVGGRSTCPEALPDAIAQIRLFEAPHSASITPDHTKWHYDELLQLLKGSDGSDQCLAQVRSLVTDRSDASSLSSSSSSIHLSGGGTASAAGGSFYDLGCRELDQTKLFLKHFPGANGFHIHCFEPNQAFHQSHEAFAAANPSLRISFYDVAAGVANGTAVLSDRNVGSSIVREQKQEAGKNGGSVKVVDFVELLVNQQAEVAASGRQSYVVVKMDIEKMEFALLHRLVESKAIVLIDDLLLECHYNTNLAPTLRNKSKHIGLDDCHALVGAMNAALRGNQRGRTFEAVLWNNAKTARSSGYVSRHNGFRPS